MKNFLVLLAIGIIAWNVLRIILPNFSGYIEPLYTDSLFHTLEDLYNKSQYRQKNPTALIPDHTVFRYAAGAYLRGVDPIYINSEHTPLGKYFIALSILVFHNDATIILFFVFLTSLAVWLLGKRLLHSGALALVPLMIFSSEPLFLDQIRIMPMLDAIQLPFILLTLYFFILEHQKSRFFFTALMIGFVIATKSVVPGILLVCCFVLFLISQKMMRLAFTLFAYLPISALVLILSYTRTFLSGYTFSQFLGFQKWIFLYQQSKLIYPFSVWKLLLFNQWQTWWGDERMLKSAEWQVWWPIFTVLLMLSIALVVLKKMRISPSYLLLSLWCVIYLSFLSIGVVSSRFLIPVLPIMYTLGIYTLKQLIHIL